MYWRGGRQSGNIEDRRNVRPVVVGGGLVGLLVLLLSLYFGVSPEEISPPDASVSAHGPDTYAAD
jgi:predicted metalloprotease